MPKKNLLISAALAAFILVIGTGIASAYQSVNASIEAAKISATADAARVVETQPLAEAVPADLGAQPAQATLTHQEAALVAANYLDQTDLYSVENVVWEGMDAYEVVFSSGDSVFVSMTGEVLGTKAPETVVIVEQANPASASVSSNTNARTTTSTSHNDDDDHGGSSEHHDDDDGHDEHDDD